ncbi:MAG: polymerase III protein [Candidatus Amesbacteria bacterium GW2011_GWB1_47_26]|uniref:Polymerase III protein n=1 Tax=Candidatus Amesbacteria bacterium GW2011_GWC2_45_19 TaxID=1618366 RepID=A0A0G1M3Y9_9BACT|nr:MAG: polymerase III protein [Candidatus Amesbacteria bacterium GW2011_GWC2_45_19]KKU38360.1 MAG: polymerase III protein [Candidatus Amesbacteria bacterium GW2011_GWA1_46_35]KKU68797.1 MAG: polymerase III, delta prime subunit, DNA polymerase III subunit delta' protein [Microgenomates group bacterium GW2011_GWC1_47_20]KKU74903.1 MAG: polymerase III protein [Candidatus Amesbacteria bacterium GW2011_GWB1_47_26]KKU80077.1 MAG: polymerase III protein [Candidatus Amesbacteria bacterium GW2011_GWA2_
MHAFLTTVNPELVEGLDTLHIIPETSIGIDEVRQIQFFLSRKPISSDHHTVIIHQAHLLTLPAQHALLKTLEEPPGNSLIYLVTSTPDSLLPTILSRVQIITTPYMSHKSNTTYMTYTSDLLKKLQEQEFTRESALKLLDDLEYLIHDMVNNSPLRPPLNLRGGSEGALYKTIADTRRYLKANCNLKLCLAHLALGLQNC